MTKGEKFICEILALGVEFSESDILKQTEILDNADKMYKRHIIDRMNIAQSVDNVTQEPKNVVSDFLTEMSDKHDEELSDVIVGFQYGNLSVQRYSEGESPQWKTLEEIKL